ncbi:hypothetical protein SKAU_G00033480 [Synaphobranchus kaupii]|uniref:Uncharacterized protein n=1 Tax=Synaphobranchus kaupii TaxID=118154 RepID=A0A9Q1GFH9_SYNKA|nr:hypothetical protein SKAU_G00033480 [Synaphobranchus kaupii]
MGLDQVKQCQESIIKSSVLLVQVWFSSVHRRRPVMLEGGQASAEEKERRRRLSGARRLIELVPRTARHVLTRGGFSSQTSISQGRVLLSITACRSFERKRDNHTSIRLKQLYLTWVKYIFLPPADMDKGKKNPTNVGNA